MPSENHPWNRQGAGGKMPKPDLMQQALAETKAHQERKRSKATGRHTVKEVSKQVALYDQPGVLDDRLDPRFLDDDTLLQLVDKLEYVDRYDWRGANARPEQLPPVEWLIWLMLAGRRFGKTRAATEYIREMCEKTPGFRVAAIAKDHRALRDVCFEGKSGLTAVIPQQHWQQKNYKKGLGDVSLVLDNGSVIIGYTSAEPDAIRGQAFDLIWGDEFAAWPRHRAQEMLDQATFTMGESEDCRMILTTTPKKLPHVKDLIRRAEDPTEQIVITRGRTEDNTALSQRALKVLRDRYDGTRQGRQEMDGELIEDVEGALWTDVMIEVARWDSEDEFPKMVGVVTAVDASGSADGDQCGIVTIGWDKDKVIYVLQNATRGGSPAERYEAAARSAHDHGASELVYESAYGGDNIAYAIQNAWEQLQRTGEIPETSKCPRLFKSTLKGDKAHRAGPVAQLYEQQANLPDKRRVWHPIPDTDNDIVKLEEELTSWTPIKEPGQAAAKSPNGLDALVHGVRRIMFRLGMEGHVSRASGNRRRRNGGYNPFG